MAVAHHTLDIYGVELHLATTKRDWSTLRRKLTFLNKTPESAGLAHFALWEPKPPGISVPHVAFWIDCAAHSDSLELVDTCAHEAAHGANHILEHIGTDIRGSNEPHAYLVGWLTRWLVERCTA